MSAFVLRMGGRAVEYTGLENRPRAILREFESHPIRHLKLTSDFLLNHKVSPKRAIPDKGIYSHCLNILLFASSDELLKRPLAQNQ